MAPSKRQAYTAFSAVYLIALTCVAVYALHTIKKHQIPIPTTLGAFTLALPAITGLAIEALTGTANNSRGTIKWSPRLGSRASLSQYVITLLFVYETVLATLAGTYLSPVSGLKCGLDERWRAMYRAKNADVISRIQDAFKCCGLHSRLDMAYPFPSKERGADACVKMYNRQSSCFDSWQNEERVAAGLLLLVAIAVAIWKILVIYMQTRGVPWSEEAYTSNEGGGNAERRTLEYPSPETPYRDQPDVDHSEDTEHVRSSRVVPSILRDDHWVGEDDR